LSGDAGAASIPVGEGDLSVDRVTNQCLRGDGAVLSVVMSVDRAMVER
jgi:hypothetical protein